jgi:predicted DNA-binding transcriptional regulator YafY
MRADRFLSILIIISQKGLVTGKELAEHFEVSLRTIYRDIEKISEAGVPIAAIGGKGGGYYLMENYTLNNLFLG